MGRSSTRGWRFACTRSSVLTKRIPSEVERTRSPEEDDPGRQGERPAEIEEFSVGEFNDNDVNVFDPPKTLATFALKEEFPKTLSVFLALGREGPRRVRRLLGEALRGNPGRGDGDPDRPGHRRGSDYRRRDPVRP